MVALSLFTLCNFKQGWQLPFLLWKNKFEFSSLLNVLYSITSGITPRKRLFIFLEKTIRTVLVFVSNTNANIKPNEFEPCIFTAVNNVYFKKSLVVQIFY
jgi:hypothetical protein